jgi:hypothetical protein
MSRRNAKSLVKAKTVDLKPLQQHLTLAAGSALFILALLLLMRP